MAIWRGTKADPLQLALQLSMSTEEVKLQVEMISGGWSAPGTSFWSTHVVPLPKRRGISSAELRYFFCMDVLDRLDFFYKLIMGEKPHVTTKTCDFWRFLPMLKIPITEDWSESWSLEAGTLQVEMSIAICGQSRFGGPDSNMARNHAFERLGK